MSEVKLDIKVSATGKNKYLNWCDANDQRRYYCTCAILIDAFNAGRLEPEGNNIHDDCALAIKRGRCSSVKLREEEIKKDESIYFEERVAVEHHDTKKVSKSSASYKLGWRKVGEAIGKDKIVKVVKPVVKKKVEKKEQELFVNVDVADVITSEANKEAEKKKRLIAKLKSLAKPGETIAQVAQRIKQSRLKKAS